MTKERGLAYARDFRRASILISIAAMILIAGCNTYGAATTAIKSSVTATVTSPAVAIDPAAQATAEANALTAILGQFSDADKIAIADNWNGYSSRAPLITNYSLTRSIEGFIGSARFSAGGHRGQAHTANESIIIPKAVAQSFLSELSKTTPKPGKYTPDISHTDDYPSLSIEVELGKQSVRFYSQSQGFDNVPWGADIMGKSYTISTGQPGQALAILQPYLRKDVLSRLEADILP